MTAIFRTMNANVDEATLLGQSYGHWEGGTLVVETVGVNAGWINQSGTPQSIDAHFVERFTRDDDGRRLRYSLTVTDPQTFTAPVTMRRSWIAMPNERLLPFRCTE